LHLIAQQKYTSRSSTQRETSDDSNDDFAENWGAKAFKSLKDIDNGKRLGEGFKATWTSARSGGNMLDLVESDSDREEDDVESGDEADEYPY